MTSLVPCEIRIDAERFLVQLVVEPKASEAAGFCIVLRLVAHDLFHSIETLTHLVRNLC